VKLSELITAIPAATGHQIGDPEITAVVEDSRMVRPGSLFVARRGREFDGHGFMLAALEAGAVAIVGELGEGQITEAFGKLRVPYLQVPEGAAAIAYLAAALHGFPARKLVMIGVTGTDGKTTTCNLIHSILRAARIPVGLITTVNAVIGDELMDTGFHVTTPSAAAVQSLLQRMVGAGMTHCVLEATSHGLAQHRVAACEFDIAVVTNITHEHLDYHGSLADYLQAKGILFESLASSVPKDGVLKLAVLNRDDEQSYEYLREMLQVEYVDYGLQLDTSVSADNIRRYGTGNRFDISADGESFSVETELTGDYNVANCLAAIAVARKGLGVPVQAVKVGISTMPAIPGRMERIDLGQDFEAVVDFAHTPNALRAILGAVRSENVGRTIVVFGSAGLRDIAKRSWMGSVAAEMADITVITAEDPRTESLVDIMADVAAGCANMGGIEGETFWQIEDRNEAIRFAVGLASPGDVVLACGKAHEQSMCFGVMEYPWDDRIAMRAAIAERMGQVAVAPPVLPTATANA
jgi:UDP-N-acetylmuramoyl-L-alanyl-D-glutamate--2,6-diaminopimelate ligase